MTSITPKLAISLSSILRQQLHSVCVRVGVCACVSVGVFSSNHQHTSAVVLICIVCIFSVSKVTKLQPILYLYIWSYKASSGQPGVAMYSSVD